MVWERLTDRRSSTLDRRTQRCTPVIAFLRESSTSAPPPSRLHHGCRPAGLSRGGHQVHGRCLATLDGSHELHGWVALGLGAFFSIDIGCGLMALMFYSSRYGYDEHSALALQPPHSRSASGEIGGAAMRQYPIERAKQSGASSQLA